LDIKLKLKICKDPTQILISLSRSEDGTVSLLPSINTPSFKDTHNKHQNLPTLDLNSNIKSMMTTTLILTSDRWKTNS